MSPFHARFQFQLFSLCSMHYIYIKIFMLVFVWLCFKFQSRFFPAECSQAKNFGFLLFRCENFCYTFWLRETFDRFCWRKLLLNRFFQQTLKIYFKSFRKYWYSRSLTSIASYYPIKELTWKKIDKHFHINSLLSFSAYREQMQIVFAYARFR